MGRMADARRRARQKAGPSREDRPPKPSREREETLDPVDPLLAPPGSRESLGKGGPPSGEWGSDARSEADRDESFVFPDESVAAPEPRGRIQLPPSGLAEDILARAEAAGVQTTSVYVPVSEPAPLARAGTAEPLPSTPETAAARSHNISFFAPSARDEKKAAEATEHLATFFLGGEEYGIDVRMVQEIIRAIEITPVPRAPEFIKGVINLRGRIIPVVDLKRKLGLGDVAPGRRTRIVVVKVRDRLIGLLVDGASQVLKIPVASIDPAPEEVVEIDANYIRGVAKLEKRLVILMDLNRILALELREAEGLSPTLEP